MMVNSLPFFTGVTSYCPTLVTSPPEVYAAILPWLYPRRGGQAGAEIIGAHVEGPFISKRKKGAHKPEFIRDMAAGLRDVQEVYGQGLSNVKIITLAPELDPEGDVVQKCAQRGITISLGHSEATLSQGEIAVQNGARLITHLFNAMTSFHHRDPGLLGLLTSKKLQGHPLFYGIIADGIHTHPAALRVAYRTNYPALCLVTDAITALGFSDGIYNLGEATIRVTGERAVIDGTDTLCGAITSLFKAVQKLIKGARCTLEEALEAASFHPAQALGIEHSKGTLDYGSDADFIILDTSEMKLLSTWIAGECVYSCAEMAGTKPTTRTSTPSND